MKSKIMFLAVLLLIGTYSLFGQKPTEEDPNVMWTYKDASFSTYPAILPNGNVLVGDGNKGDVIEINGQTGQLVRRIPLPAPTSSLILSKDGTRMAASGYIINTETGAVIKAHPRAAAVRFLNPSNAKIIYTLFNQKDTSWVVWDMENDTYQNYQIPYLVTTIDVSSDGRFLAVASKETRLPINDQRTHFYLYDAQTMKLIRELEDVVAEGRTIEFIQFSENAKYVGYGHKFGGTPKGTFFRCEPPYKKWVNVDKPIDTRSISFIKDDYAILCAGGAALIFDINSSKSVFRTLIYGAPFLIYYNNNYSSLLTINSQTLALTSLNFDIILGVDNDRNIPSIHIEYNKGKLFIEGFTSTSINISINDLQGKVVFSQQILSNNSQIEIPLDLMNGVYILQIQDGNQSFSKKFLVVE
jgi:hypothetical protein